MPFPERGQYFGLSKYLCEGCGTSKKCLRGFPAAPTCSRVSFICRQVGHVSRKGWPPAVLRLAIPKSPPLHRAAYEKETHSHDYRSTRKQFCGGPESNSRRHPCRVAAWRPPIRGRGSPGLGSPSPFGLGRIPASIGPQEARRTPLADTSGFFHDPDHSSRNSSAGSRAVKGMRRHSMHEQRQGIPLCRTPRPFT